MTAYLLYRSDAWMSTSSMELIGVFSEDDFGDCALSEAVRAELRDISKVPTSTQTSGMCVSASAST